MVSVGWKSRHSGNKGVEHGGRRGVVVIEQNFQVEAFGSSGDNVFIYISRFSSV